MSQQLASFIRRTEPRGRVPLVVLADDSVPGGIGACLLYVDGYIRGPDGPWERVPRNSTTTLVMPGTHRVTVREADRRKIGRMESNTLLVHFGARNGVLLGLSFNDGSLLLTQEA